MPRTSSNDPSCTGNREKPVSRAFSTRSATVASARRASTRTRGVISSPAVRSPNRNDRPSSTAVPWSRVPCSADVRTRAPSSSGDRAEASSSTGSTPRRRTSQFAELFIQLINQRKTAENPAWMPTTSRAVSSGLAIARFFGTSSPNTIDNAVAIARARASETPAATPCGTPRPARPGSISEAIAGSAM